MGKIIIIDGYNLIGVSVSFDLLSAEGFEKERERMVDTLSSYYKLKMIPITIVFDGWKNGGFSENQDLVKNIRIIYSRRGETADEVIKRLIITSGTSAIIVSSDREIVNFSEAHGATSITSREFSDKLAMATYYQEKGLSDKEDDYLDKPIHTKKKGNPKKLPRAERKKKNRLKKL